jgi:hypothetical protein
MPLFKDSNLRWVNRQICWPVRAFGFSLGLGRLKSVCRRGGAFGCRPDRVGDCEGVIRPHPEQSGICSAVHGRSAALVKCMPTDGWLLIEEVLPAELALR